MDNDDILFFIICSALFILTFIIFLIGTNFYNDYKCSTTTDPNYWVEHNCIRYCKECKSDYNK